MSLSSLVGQYMSDSDNDDEHNNSYVSKSDVPKTIRNIENGEELFSPPATSWTQCVDPATEHPYYWNIETKEVTWEKPIEYELYINYILEKFPQIPNNCWVIGYTEDNKTPYYVNEYTRVVSWKKPLSYKEPIINQNYPQTETIGATSLSQETNKNDSLVSEVKSTTSTTTTTKTVSKKSQNDKTHKKKLNIEKGKKLQTPKHLEKNPSDDEKIELINSYSGASSDSSTDDDSKKNAEGNKVERRSKLQKAKKKIALVAAAYGTDDDESETEIEENSEKPKLLISSNNEKLSSSTTYAHTAAITPSAAAVVDDMIKSSSTKETSSSCIGAAAIEKGSNSSSSSSLSSTTNSLHNIQTDSFASIITGGKADDAKIDEEINKLKMELEKELPAFENSKMQQKSLDENHSSVENNFDEKMFKRKRRIQFSTGGSGVSAASTQISTPTSAIGTCVAESIENSLQSDTGQTKKYNEKKNLYSNFKKSHVEFGNNSRELPAITISTATVQVSGATDDSDENSKGEKCKTANINDHSNDDDDDDNGSSSSLFNRNILKSKINDLSDLIVGKVKFLSIGRPEVSAVQIMCIQLETLLAAYRSASLDSNYFFKWLKTISDDLRNLEQSAAPDGWECNWDRQSSQYFYKNLKTEEIRWEFPVTEEKEQFELLLKNDEAETSMKKESKEGGGEKENEANTADVNIGNTDNATGEQIPALQILQQSDDGGNVRGEDEMDISTTPPPNEHEQIKFMGAYSLEGAWNVENSRPVVISSEPKPVDISGELASFYSDLATIEAVTTVVSEPISTTTTTVATISVSTITTSSTTTTTSATISSDPPSPPPPPIITVTPTTITTTDSSTLAVVTSDDNRSVSPPPPSPLTIATSSLLSPSSVIVGASIDLKQLKKKSTRTTTEVDGSSSSGIPPKKKRKKIKVQGMGQKMKEVSTLVAKWQKVQKELDS